MHPKPTGPTVVLSHVQRVCILGKILLFKVAFGERLQLGVLTLDLLIASNQVHDLSQEATASSHQLA